MNENKSKYLKFDEVFYHIDMLMATIGIRKIYYGSTNVVNNIRIFQFFLGALSICNMSLLTIQTVIYVFTCKYDCLILTLDVTANILIGVVVFIKFVTLLVRRKSIYELIHTLKLLWPQADDEKAVERFNKIVMPTKKLCSFYMLVTANAAFVIGLTPAVSALFDYVQFGRATIKLGFPTWYPFDYEESMPVSIYVFISQFWTGFTAAVLMSTIDSFLCILISLICYHFESISDFLKTFQPVMHDTENSTTIKIVNDELKKCIFYHIRILKLCKLLEDIFSLAMFVNFSLSAVINCAVLFNIMVATPDKMSGILLVITSTIIQVFMICWHSDKLILQSSKLTRAAFQSDWFNMDRQFRMNIIQLQLRASKPSRLTAMNFFTLSLPTFLTILGSSWSYFTLMRTMYGR